MPLLRVRNLIIHVDVIKSNGKIMVIAFFYPEKIKMIFQHHVPLPLLLVRTALPHCALWYESTTKYNISQFVQSKEKSLRRQLQSIALSLTLEEVTGTL